MDKIFKNKKYAVYLSIFAMLLWGSAVPMIKISYQMMGIELRDIGSKILIAAIRFFMAGLLSLLYSRFIYSDDGNKEKPVKRKNWPYIFTLALVQTAVQYTFYYIGLANTEGVAASVIQAANAFFVVILSAIFIKEEYIDRKRLLALIIGTSGVIVSSLQKGQGFSFNVNGEGFILIATLFNAGSSVIVRKWGRDSDPFHTTGMQFIIGALIMMAFTLIIKPQNMIITLPAFILLLYGSFISATSYSIWVGVLANQEAGEFGIYKILIPIFGALLSVVFLKEILTFNLVIGLFLVLIGVYVLNKK